MLEQFVFKDLEFVPWYSGNDGKEKRERLTEQCAEIKNLMQTATTTFKRNSIMIGMCLAKIEQEQVYYRVRRSDFNKFFCYGDSFIDEPFYKFCARYFGLSKSTVYALKGLYYKFSDLYTGEVLDQFKAFGHSQLVEMLSLPKEKFSDVKPEMTVREIRKLKPKPEKEDKKEQPKKVDAPTSKVKKNSFFDDVSSAQKREEFYKAVKYIFERDGYKLVRKKKTKELDKAKANAKSTDKPVIEEKPIGGQAFGVLLFDYLNFKGFFNYEDKKANDN